MLKRTLCLIALLAGNPLSLAGQDTETTPKRPKKESWLLVKKVKQACVNHPVGATLGVAAAITVTAYLAITYTSTGSKIPKPQIPQKPVNDKIQVTVKLSNKQHTFEKVRVSKLLDDLISDAIETLDPSDDNPAYECEVFYEGKPIEANEMDNTLKMLGIKNNAVLELRIDKQPVSFTVKYRTKEITIQADKRNSLDWLKQELRKKVNIPIERQELYLGEKLLSNESFKKKLNSSNPEEQIVELREMKKITLTVELEGNTYTLKGIETNKKLNRVIALVTKKLGPLQKRAYQYSISYKGAKIRGNYKEITLKQCGIEEDAEIKLIADDKQPISLTVQYGNDEPKKELTIQADKRNTFGWLKKQLFNRLNISVDNQVVTFKGIGDFFDTIPYDDQRLSDYEAFNSSNKAVIELWKLKE